ncbi:hypothetical protein BMF94_1404 [Rhodotorula taiwanensis]|uniref:Uncharacterized protein n=1 Tax=Rhodotorula taiwanensis TaxID=741276 RepID=A0A2S5BFF3_9BASI|nr:hypothetical protein BMF94_1404 [Rhodotorula taiwanensis]
MLKRLSSSFTKDAQPPNDLALLRPPRTLLTPLRTPGFASPRSSPKRASFPYDNSSSYPFPIASAHPAARSTGAQQDRNVSPNRTIERAVLHKTLTNLSSLLVALDELRDTSQTHSKARKHVAKATRDLADGFKEKSAGAGGKSDEVAEALVSCASMLEALQEVEEKHARALRKEYEGLNDAIARYFRKTAKEEKAHEDRLADLDARVAKATASYQSTARAASASSQRNMHAALDSTTAQHSSYMHELSSLSAQIKQVKTAYAGEVASRREVATREVASTLCAIAEREWRQDVEAVRRGAETLGRLVSAAVWVAPGMERVAVAAPPEPPGNGERANRAVDMVLHPQRRPEEPPFAQGASRAPSSTTTETTNSSSMVHQSTYPDSPSSRVSNPAFTAASSAAGEAGPAPTFSSQRATSPRLENSEQRQQHFLPDRTASRGTTEEQHALGPPMRSPPLQFQATPTVGSSRPLGLASTVPALQDRSAMARKISDQALDRQDSFVARMSRKYSVADHELPSHAPEDPGPSRHVRSDSRVSQLAKRYSAPPQSVDSRSPPTPVSIPPHRQQPLPAWIGTGNATIGDHFSTSSRSNTDQALERGGETAHSNPPARIWTPGSARLRAYQMATPLPREPQ